MGGIMRTNKYRAFLKREKVMLPVIGLDYDYKGEGILVDVITINPSGDPEADVWENGLEDVELMQFTGLKDANGTEIYEGDIVIDEDAIGVIEYVETGFYFKAKIQSDLYDEIDAEYNFDEDFKVLGNRFENPELLKED